MNEIVPSARLASIAWFGIVGVTVIVAAVAIASGMGVIATTVAGRFIGMAFGLMIAFIGSCLPKLQPFDWMRVEASSATVERFSGGILVLAGIGWIALFTLAPLYHARQVSALIGIGAMSVIGVSWLWLTRKAWLAARERGGEAPVLSGHAATKRQSTGWLLFAFFYAFAIACVKFLVDQKQFANELSMWILAGFWLLYAALYAAFGHRRSR